MLNSNWQDVELLYTFGLRHLGGWIRVVRERIERSWEGNDVDCIQRVYMCIALSRTSVYQGRVYTCDSVASCVWPSAGLFVLAGLVWRTPGIPVYANSSLLRAQRTIHVTYVNPALCVCLLGNFVHQPVRLPRGLTLILQIVLYKQQPGHSERLCNFNPTQSNRAQTTNYVCLLAIISFALLQNHFKTHLRNVTNYPISI